MKTLPSKELLSTVLEDTIYSIKSLENSAIFGSKQLWISSKKFDCAVNIYELAHKCKEWAYSKGYTLASYQSGENWYVCRDPHKSNPYVGEVTEPEAIFKACELILKDKR